MKNIIKYILGISLVFYSTSCDTDFLNVTPEDRFPEESSMEGSWAGRSVCKRNVSWTESWNSRINVRITGG